MNIKITLIFISINIFKIIYCPKFQEIIEARLRQKHKKPKSRRDKSKNIHSKSFNDKRDEQIKIIIEKMNEEIHNVSKLQALKMYRMLAYERILKDDLARKLIKQREKPDKELQKNIDDIIKNIKDLRTTFFDGSIVERDNLYHKLAEYEINFRKINDEKCESIDKIITELIPIIRDEIDKRVEFMSIYFATQNSSDNQTNQTILQNTNICVQNCSSSSQNEENSNLNIDLQRINFLVNKLTEYSIKKVMDDSDVQIGSIEEMFKEIHSAIVKSTLIENTHYSIEINESICQRMISYYDKKLCKTYIPYVKKLTGLQIKYILYQNPTEFERQISILKNKIN